MVRNASPGIAEGVGFGEGLADSAKKVLSILIIEKDPPPFYCPDDGMVHNTRGIQSCKSSHVTTVITSADRCKLNHKWTLFSVLLLLRRSEPRVYLWYRLKPSTTFSKWTAASIAFL